MNLGMALAELALAKLLCMFGWELPNHGVNEQGIDLSEGNVITVRKKSPLLVMAIASNKNGV